MMRSMDRDLGCRRGPGRVRDHGDHHSRQRRRRQAAHEAPNHDRHLAARAGIVHVDLDGAHHDDDSPADDYISIGAVTVRLRRRYGRHRSGRSDAEGQLHLQHHHRHEPVRRDQKSSGLVRAR